VIPDQEAWAQPRPECRKRHMTQKWRQSVNPEEPITAARAEAHPGAKPDAANLWDAGTLLPFLADTSR